MLFLLLFRISLSLNINDTESLRYFNITAAPTVFGYSEARGSELFPKYIYPKCRSTNKESLFINYTSNKLTYTCTDPNSFIVIGPSTKVTIANPSVTSNFVKKSSISEEIHITSSTDFAVGWCKKSENTAATEFFLFPRFKSNSYLSALQSMRKSHENSSAEPRSKPLLLLFLTPDSLSRSHFYRKLPQTVEYLNSLKDYRVYDFKLHNVIGADTSENQMLVFGETWVKNFPGSQFLDYHGASAIWSILKPLGFMTMWGTDACADNVPRSMGRVPAIDHVVNLFFCSQYVYGNYRAAKQLMRQQRCMGSKMPHSYLMEYTLNFTKMYGRANQWIYNHFTPAHEGSGQHAQTLDSDLKEYLETYLEQVRDTHEVVVILAADHGMRYGDFMSDSESIQEHRLPAFFLIASQEFLGKIPGAEKILEKNSWRLNTKPDLRKTMIELAGKYMSVDVDTDRKYYDLFREIIPEDRSCEDAGIPIWYCATYAPVSVSKEVLFGNKELTSQELMEKKIVFEVLRRIIEFINKKSYRSVEMPLGFLCEEVSANEISSANFLMISKKHYIVRVVFNLNESTQAEYDGWVELKDIGEDPIIFNGEKLYTSMIHIARFDKHRNPCELQLKELGFDSEYCICDANLSLIKA